MDAADRVVVLLNKVELHHGSAFAEVSEAELDGGTDRRLRMLSPLLLRRGGDLRPGSLDRSAAYASAAISASTFR